MNRTDCVVKATTLLPLTEADILKNNTYSMDQIVDHPYQSSVLQLVIKLIVPTLPH